jgi:hypothetical protein
VLGGYKNPRKVNYWALVGGGAAVGPPPVLLNLQEKRMRVSNCHENHIFPAQGGELVDLILVSLLGLIGNATPYPLRSHSNRPGRFNIKSKLP